MTTPVNPYTSINTERGFLLPIGSPLLMLLAFVISVFGMIACAYSDKVGYTIHLANWAWLTFYWAYYFVQWRHFKWLVLHEKSITRILEIASYESNRIQVKVAGKDWTRLIVGTTKDVRDATKGNMSPGQLRRLIEYSCDVAYAINRTPFQIKEIIVRAFDQAIKKSPRHIIPDPLLSRKRHEAIMEALKCQPAPPPQE